MKLLLVLLALVGLTCAKSFSFTKSVPRFAFVEEWQLWKSAHSKQYLSQKEELEKHLVWLSNREYILGHNANADIFGYSLELNHFGDMVQSFLFSVYRTHLHSFRIISITV